MQQNHTAASTSRGNQEYYSCSTRYQLLLRSWRRPSKLLTVRIWHSPSSKKTEQQRMEKNRLQLQSVKGKREFEMLKTSYLNWYDRHVVTPICTARRCQSTSRDGGRLWAENSPICERIHCLNALLALSQTFKNLSTTQFANCVSANSVHENA